jgi:3-hydroxyisobutyrate dehydrogenase-like beta-hydroxyacid dehydrogenase
MAPSPDEVRRVGFIGLGIMGRPMARNIMQAGYDLVVHSRSRRPVDELVASGAHAAADAAEVASRSDVVIIMVASTEDLEAVLDGPRGVIAGAHEGLIVVDMGSHDPSAMPGLAGRCAQAGAELLDAPVSGGEDGAEQATLSIMVGGTAAALKRAGPVLATMGTGIVHVGDTGAGMVAKACNQLVVGSTIEAVAEALTLARVAGVDPARVREALLGGYASSRVLEVHGRRMLERDFAPGARAAIHDKDAGIILGLAAGLGVDIPGFVPVAEAFRSLVEQGGADLDHSALITLLE